MENKLKVEGKVNDLVNKLSVEYLSYISTSANQICENTHNKKILNPQHILEALKSKNFHSHIDTLKIDLKLVENDVENNNPDNGNNTNSNNLNKSEKKLEEVIKKLKPKKEKKEKFVVTQELIDLQNKILNENKLMIENNIINNNINSKFTSYDDNFNTAEENYD